MKRIVLPLVWLVIAINVAQAEQTAEELKTYLTNAFIARQNVLANVHDIKFEPGWQPVVNIGLPKDLNAKDAEELWALYDPSPRQFFFNEKIEAIVGPEALKFKDFGRDKRVHCRSHECSPVMMIIDHELGHAYADQVSRRLELGQFPPCNDASVSNERQLGYRLLSEGIATWFEYTSMYGIPYVVSYSVFPSSSADRQWRLLNERFYFYQGAYWLTGPLLDYHPTQGVEYLLKHPLVYEKGNLREAMQVYREEIFRAMPAEAHYGQALKAVMRVMEGRLGITFPAGAPSIIFSDNPCSGNDMAEYQSKENRLVVHSRYRSVNLASIIANAYVPRYLKEEHEEAEILNEVRGILARELGHYYVDLLTEQDYPNSWLAKTYEENERYAANRLPFLIVSEGIAEYFVTTFREKPAHFPQESWQKKVTPEELKKPSMMRDLSCRGGYHFVKPLLQQNSEAAIRYLLTHPLILELPDLSGVVLYQKKAIEALVPKSGEE